VESAGIREPKGCVQAPGRWNNRPWVDRVVADKAKAYCPRLEGLAPWFLRSRNCPDTYIYEFLNNVKIDPEEDAA
jgi:hypothetical protein